MGEDESVFRSLLDFDRVPFVRIHWNLTGRRGKSDSTSRGRLKLSDFVVSFGVNLTRSSKVFVKVVNVPKRGREVGESGPTF